MTMAQSTYEVETVDWSLRILEPYFLVVAPVNEEPPNQVSQFLLLLSKIATWLSPKLQLQQQTTIVCTHIRLVVLGKTVFLFSIPDDQFTNTNINLTTVLGEKH